MLARAKEGRIVLWLRVEFGDGDHRRRRLFIFEVSVGIYTVLLVGLSIFLFMINSAADQIQNLITSQNSAALTLWSNIDEYKHYLAIDPKANAEATLPPGFVADLVNFSRTNATILETLYRLSYQGVRVLQENHGAA